MGVGTVKPLYSCNAPAQSGATDTRRLVVLAFLVAVALVVSFIESMLPPAILLAPGAKLGLGNIAPLIALIILGVGDAFIVTALKCLLGAIVTGGVSGAYVFRAVGHARACRRSVVVLHGVRQNFGSNDKPYRRNRVQLRTARRCELGNGRKPFDIAAVVGYGGTARGRVHWTVGVLYS